MRRESSRTPRFPGSVGQSRADQLIVRQLSATDSKALAADTPFRSLVNGQWLIPLGRRLPSPTGNSRAPWLPHSNPRCCTSSIALSMSGGRHDLGAAPGRLRAVPRASAAPFRASPRPAIRSSRARRRRRHPDLCARTSNRTGRPISMPTGSFPIRRSCSRCRCRKRNACRVAASRGRRGNHRGGIRGPADFRLAHDHARDQRARRGGNAHRRAGEAAHGRDEQARGSRRRPACERGAVPVDHGSRAHDGLAQGPAGALHLRQSRRSSVHRAARGDAARQEDHAISTQENSPSSSRGTIGPRSKAGARCSAR